MLNFLDNVVIGMRAKYLMGLSAVDNNFKQSIEGLGGAGSDNLEGVSTMVDNYGKATFNIGQKVAIYVAALALIGLGLGFLIHGGNANKTAEVKTSVVPKVVGIIIIFAVVGALGFLQTIGTGLFGAAN